MPCLPDVGAPRHVRCPSESGTGKEATANAIHVLSKRASRADVAPYRHTTFVERSGFAGQFAPKEFLASGKPITVASRPA
jgi:hypothetical protein